VRARCILLFLLAPPATCEAQLAATGAATAADRYVWRGVTRVNGWVLQPQAELAARAGPATLTAGVWANVELSRAGAGDVGDRGADRRGLGELDVEVSAGADIGPVGVTVGWVRYTYHGDPMLGGRDPTQNTSELFTAVAWRSTRVGPELVVFRDIGGRREWYAEAAIGLPLFASPEPRPAAVISLRPLAAWSAGPGPDRGLTHLDLPLTLDFQLPGTLLEPAVSIRLHTQWNRDSATRITDAVGGSTRVKLWGELTVSAAAFPDRRRRR
jgi:hypothetical protein